MSHHTVPAGNGLQWLTAGLTLTLKNPGPFALMGLLVAVIALVPVLGGLALILLAPALYGGIMFAAREQEAGRAVDFQQLFQAFREQGKLGKMILLCLPGIAAGIVIVVLGAILIGGAVMAVLGAGGSESALGAGAGVGALLFVVLALAIGLVSFALMPAMGEAVPEFSWLWAGAAIGLGLASAIIQLTMNWAQKSVSATRATVTSPA